MRNVLLILAVIILTCCKTTERVEYVPVETVKTEYKDRIVETYDSVHITDSVYVAVKGDTTLVYKYRDRWKLKLVHDTAYVNRTDSIRIPYPVEKKLSKWEQFKVDYCGYLMMVILAAFGYIIFRIIRRVRNLSLIHI